MIVLSDEGRDAVHVGRGFGHAEPPKKRPTATKLWNDAVDAYGKRKIYWTDKAKRPADLTDVFANLGRAMSVKGKAGAAQPLDLDAQALLWKLCDGRRRHWDYERFPGTRKVARMWLGVGGGDFAIRAVLRSMELVYTFNVNGWGTIAITNATLDRRAACCVPLREQRWQSADLIGLRELRLQLAHAEQSVYDAAVAAVRDVWDGVAEPEARMALAYLVPDQTDLADTLVAELGGMEKKPQWVRMLAHLPLSIEQFGAFAKEDNSHYRTCQQWLWGMITLHGEDATDMLVSMTGSGVYHQAYEPVMACVINEKVAKVMRHADDQTVKESYFLAAPEFSLEFLAADDPVRARVLRAHPHLNPDAKPQATLDQLPACFAETVRTKKSLNDEWTPYTDLYLVGREVVLSPEQFTQMGLLLRRAKGTLTAETQAIRDALDPESADAFAIALDDALGHYRSGDRRWMHRSLGILGHDAVVDRLSGLVTKQQYADAVVTLEILANIGSDRALIRVNHVASRGRGGVKRAAQGQIRAIGRRRGLTTGQLADRLVPTLGLDPRGTLHLDFGPRGFTVGFDEQLKPYVTDDAGKRRKSLPKPGKKDDAELAGAATQRWKDLKKDVRTLASAQIARFEESMSMARRWTRKEFDTFLRGHPLLVHLVRRLIWAVYDGESVLQSFRVDETGDAVDVEDEAVELHAGTIGIAHPLDLDDVDAWGQVLGDYELIQPFPQLSRRVFRAGSTEVDDLVATVAATQGIKGGTIAGLLNKGWERGSVEDAGQYYSVWRRVGKVTAELHMDPGVNIGGYYGFDMEQKLRLEISGSGDPREFSEVVYQASTVL